MEYITRSELFENLGDKNSPLPNYGLIPKDGKISLTVNDISIIEFNNLDFKNLNYNNIDTSILIQQALMIYVFHLDPIHLTGQDLILNLNQVIQ